MLKIFGRTADQKYNDLYESFKIIQNDYDALRVEYKNMQAENEMLRKAEAALREENRVLREENTVLKATVNELTEMLPQINGKLRDLAEKNASLTEIVKRNSGNSSKPPSSDGYMKPPVPKSLRTKTGKKVGGQPGHEGHGLILNREPDVLIPHYPKECEACPYHENGCIGCDRITKTGYVYDIEFRTVLIEHRAIQRECPLSNGQLNGEMPEGVNGTLQYGEGLTAFAATLYTRGMVSYNRIAELLDGAFDIPISVGILPIMIQKCVGKIMPALEMVKKELQSTDVINNDETGLRVDGRLHWAHVACNKLYTYITVSARRGKEGIDEAGIMPFFNGKSIHDCWFPYFTYLEATHGICNDHILRELQSVTDNQRQPWAKDMSDLLLLMKDERDANAAKGEVCSTEERIEEISIAYDAIIAKARAQNTSNEVNKKGLPVPINKKVAALINRLELRKGGVCLFFKDYTVPRSNNQAERDLRMLKVKAKVSGCFRTYDGSSDFVSLMSFLTTAKKHGANAYSAILAALQGRAMDVVFPVDKPVLKTT